MKRKSPSKPADSKPEADSKQQPVIHPEILEDAKRSLLQDRAKTLPKCMVCGSETATGSAEPLCWVCRRLKISAWRDVEQQMPAQE
jgi:hypothetical protein